VWDANIITTNESPCEGHMALLKQEDDDVHKRGKLLLKPVTEALDELYHSSLYGAEYFGSVSIKCQTRKSRE